MFLSNLIAHLAKLSFAKGCSPLCFKSVLVVLVLKKPALDSYAFESLSGAFIVQLQLQQSMDLLQWFDHKLR